VCVCVCVCVCTFCSKVLLHFKLFKIFIKAYQSYYTSMSRLLFREYPENSVNKLIDFMSGLWF